MNARHKVRKKKPEGSDAGFESVFKHSFFGFLFGFFILIILLLVGAGVASNTDDPDSLMGILAFSALYVSALLCGLITTKRCGKNSMISGALSGVWLVILLSLISFFLKSISSDVRSWGVELAIRGSVILVSALGGYIGANRPKSRNKKRRRG